MPKSLPFFKFDADAWLTGKVQLLSTEEKGTLIDLLARIWKENGAIKNDEILHRLLRVDKATLNQALSSLFEIGIVCEKDGFLSVKFLSEQLQQRENYIAKQSAIGKKGGRPKKGTKPKQKEESRKKIFKNSSDTVVSSEFTLEPEIPGDQGSSPKKIFFDYNGDGRLHGIDEEQIAFWQEMYPAIDVEEELKKATSWLDGNRKNRKSDVKRFLVNWLSRVQDNAKTVINSKRKPIRDYTGL